MLWMGLMGSECFRKPIGSYGFKCEKILDSSTCIFQKDDSVFLNIIFGILKA